MIVYFELINMKPIVFSPSDNLCMMAQRISLFIAYTTKCTITETKTNNQLMQKKVSNILWSTISAFLLSILFTGTVFAEEDYVHEDELFEDVQTVVSATRLKQKISDAPVSVTIIDSDMIAASGATEIHELLRFVPGYFTYSVWGNQFGVSNHFQPKEVSTRLEVQINGRSVYEPLFTAVDWTTIGIDVADIDYIEVVRGSSATTYGSNAFLGAINIITKNVLSRPKASVRSTLGNIGRKDLSVNHSGNLKDLDYGLSLVYRSNSGFSALGNSAKPRDQSNDDRDSLHLGLQGNYVPDLNNEIEFEVGMGRSRIELPTNGDARGYSNQDHTNNYQKIKWTHKAKDKQSSLMFYHNYLGLDDDFSLGLLSSVLNVSPELIPVLFAGQQDEVINFGPDDSFSQRYNLEFEQKNTFLNKIDYVWGLGARRDKVKSQLFFGNEAKSENRFKLFGNMDWHINEMANANLGILVENTKFSGSVYSPRVALNLHPGKRHTIRTSITQGKHVPSVTFQNLFTASYFSDGSLIDVETIRAEDISSEKVTAYEIAYISKMPEIKTQFDIKLFREEMDDFAALQVQPFDDLDGKVRVVDNVLDLTTQGVELQLTHEFDVVPKLKARLAYAFLETEGTYALDITTEPNRIRQASALPKHSATLLLTKKLANQYDLSSVLQYQSDYQNRGVDLKRVDLRLGKKFNLSNTQGKVDFVIQNAFNKYNDFASRNVFEPRAYIRMQLDF